MAQPKVNPGHFLYTRLATAHGSFPARIAGAGSRSKQTCPDNNFSIVLSDDGLEAVCKIAGADPEWISGQPWARPPIPVSGVLDLYTKDDHHRLLALFADDPNWSKTREE